MATGNKLIQLGVFLCLSLALFAVIGACGTPTETVKEIEVIKEVPVDREVVKEVIKEVPVDVIKEVVKEVIVPQEVIKEVPKEVIKEVVVEVQVTPVPKKKDTIVFSDLNWTSAQVQNRIAQYIVEKGYGYPTDLDVFGGTLPLFQGLKAGDTHVTMEIWLPNQSIGWEEAIELGEVVSVGKSLVGDWQSTFVVPAYVTDANPDLKTPQDLMKPEYQELFSTADSRGKARLVACVPGWSCELVNDAQIESYGLSDSLHVIKPGSQDAMFSEIFGAYEKQEPWLGYMWGTGDPALKLDLVRLEEPAYTKECWDSDKACAFDNSLVLVAVHKDLLPRAPEVIGFLQDWEFTIDIYKGIFQWMDANPDSTPAEAATEWLKTQESIWTSWVTAEAAAKVKAALAAGEEADGWPDE